MRWNDPSTILVHYTVIKRIVDCSFPTISIAGGRGGGRGRKSFFPDELPKKRFTPVNAPPPPPTPEVSDRRHGLRGVCSSECRRLL